MNLELYARHLSLPEIGVAGQERLLAAQVDCAIPDIALALHKMGVRIVPGAALRIYEDETVLLNTVDFNLRAHRSELDDALFDDLRSDAGVAIGPQSLTIASHRDASAPLRMKERFMGALIASEVVLWILKVRPVRYSLRIDYPTYKLQID